jgi:hypothetical protein
MATADSQQHEEEERALLLSFDGEEHKHVTRCVARALCCTTLVRLCMH